MTAGTPTLKQAANLLSFYTENEMARKKDVLLRLIERMAEEAKVIWALICSSSFYFRGLVDEFHDFDIMVGEESIEEFIRIFVKMGGILQEGNDNGKGEFFRSKFFRTGKLDGVDIDIISGFTVTTYDTKYCYELRKEHIEYVKGIIPLSPIEADLILYGMMIQWQPRRMHKFDLAMEYLQKTGVRHIEILRKFQMDSQSSSWMPLKI